MNYFKKYKRYIKYILIIALLGELYFYPFQGEFRFSAGVIAFSLILLLEENLKELVLGFSTGFTVLILRGFINIVSSQENIFNIIKIDLPAAIYYIIFSLLAYLFSLKQKRDDPIVAIPIIFLIDILSNLFETLLRGSLNYELFKYIFLIALIRSVITYGVFIIFRNQEFLIRKKEHEKRYNQLNHIISNIQAETFYLKKSMMDIEALMGMSHDFYEKNKDNPDIKNTALNIAREVHEIKKDYQRVVKGLEGFVEEIAKEDSMKFKDITHIIEGNINRYIKQIDKDIIIDFNIQDNIFIKNYYLIFTLLNNLIINGIDAIEESGRISITEKIVGNNLILIVKDDGEGIEKDVLEYIFSPGFTTKFDNNTGEASTGIGLSHVQNIVEDLKGNIDINSEIHKGTEFKISIPLALLRR